MFAASFPLAPVLALLIGLIDLRFDAKRLLWILRRPVAFIASDLGEIDYWSITHIIYWLTIYSSLGVWLPILRFLCLCGVISNAFIVAFVSSFCEDFFETDDVTLSQRLIVFLTFEVMIINIDWILSIIMPRYWSMSFLDWCTCSIFASLANRPM